MGVLSLLFSEFRMFFLSSPILATLLIRLKDKRNTGSFAINTRFGEGSIDFLYVYINLWKPFNNMRLITPEILKKRLKFLKVSSRALENFGKTYKIHVLLNEEILPTAPDFK